MSPREDLHIEEAILDDAVHSELNYLEVPNSRNAFLLVGVFAVLITSVVVVRVGFLSFFQRSVYTARASTNLSREISLPSYRAVIVDRYGEPLVKNESSFSVFVSLQLYYKDEEEFLSVVKEIADILKKNESEIIEVFSEVDPNSGAWVPVARDIDSAEAIAIKGLNIDDVQVVDDYRRLYPDGPVFSHLIGYTGIEKGNSIVGKAGLELQYEDRIRGEDGKYVFYQDARGEVLGSKLVSAPKPSEELKTTIDADLQRYFYQRLKSTLDSSGRTSGIGIALDPRNGEVLSLVGFPTFDNNVFVDSTKSGERSEILNDSSRPLFNRMISGVYSPGSTIKPLVALAALREGVVNTETKIFSSGVLSIPNPYNPDLPSNFLDWKAHGWVSVFSALARSSNIYFYAVGGGLPASVRSTEDLTRDQFSVDGLGIERLKSYWEKFGFGQKTGIDIPGESLGLLPGPDEEGDFGDHPWRLGDTYNVSIGQGDLLVTPIQLANFFASVANGGVIYRPHLYKDESSSVIFDYSNWSDEIAAVKEGLREGVKDPSGSSHILSTLPFSVAGKTGTPQTHNKARVNALFSGYGPVENPEISILVFIENAKEGSLNALPVAYDVFDWYYKNRISNGE